MKWRFGKRRRALLEIEMIEHAALVEVLAREANADAVKACLQVCRSERERAFQNAGGVEQGTEKAAGWAWVGRGCEEVERMILALIEEGRRKGKKAGS